MESETPWSSEEESGLNLHHHLMSQRKRLFQHPETVLQRLVVAARLPRDAGAAGRKQLAAHFEDLVFQLGKQHQRDQVSGLLLVYPSCLLHVVESTREVLVSLLEDVAALQRHQCSLLEAKIIFITHNLGKRLFQRWSCKVLKVARVAGGAVVEGKEEQQLEQEDEEEDRASTEVLVCGVLAALQKLGTESEPGPPSDRDLTLAIRPKTLEKLLDGDLLQSPSQYLQTYASPLHVHMEFGHNIPRSLSLSA